MSIQGEIDRLSAAKASIAASLQAMGIEPPEGTTLEQYAAQLAAIATAAPWLSIPGGGTMQMGESLGAGPYTIEVTEDGEGGDLSVEQVGYSNTGSGLEATNVQEAIDELAQKGGGEYLPLTGGTMTGPLTLSGLPTSENHAANKQYVDTSVEQVLGSIGYSLIKEYTSPGSFTHTFDRKYTDVFVVVVGAGGGGGSHGDHGGGGGGGGAAACFHVLDSSTIQSNSIVVGAGGAGGGVSLGEEDYHKGSNGGSSSAFGITVPGGNCDAGNKYGPSGGLGGGDDGDYDKISPGWLMIGGGGGGQNNDGQDGPILSVVGFKPFCGGGGGGGAPSLNDPPNPGGNGGDGGGGNGGAGATMQTNATNGTNGTRGGGGGGAGSGNTFRSSENKPSGRGGKGGDGYVAIYARGIS